MKRVSGSGALVRIEVTTAAVEWLVLVTPRELKAMDWGVAEGTAVALDLPIEALHVIPADHGDPVSNSAQPGSV